MQIYIDYDYNTFHETTWYMTTKISVIHLNEIVKPLSIVSKVSLHI